MKVLEVDSRGRVSLGELGRHDRYIVQVGPDDVITLIPAVLVPLDRFNKMMEDVRAVRAEQ